MNEPQSAAGERTVKIGPDRVTIKSDEVIIDAKREMPDWQVREFNVIPIFFEEQKYYLVHKTKAEKPYAVRYILRPWVNGQFDAARISLGYDVHSVTERDAGCRGERNADLAYAFLLPFYPFIGFLWSGTQNRLAAFGFIPRTITNLSVFVAFLVAFCEVAFTSISINASARSGHLMIGGILKMFLPWSAVRVGPLAISVGWFDIAIFVLFAIDAIMRHTYAGRDDQWHCGFMEWVFKKSLRPNW
jgi:hypothetical protein